MEKKKKRGGGARGWIIVEEKEAARAIIFAKGTGRVIKSRPFFIPHGAHVGRARSDTSRGKRQINRKIMPRERKAGN